MADRKAFERMKRQYLASKKLEKAIKKGDCVQIKGVVEFSDPTSNYIEVRIHDGICGMNTVRLTIHRRSVKPS